jgi:hypothetical protein
MDEYPNNMKERTRKKLLAQLKQIRSEKRERNYNAIIGARVLGIAVFLCLVLSCVLYFLAN